MLAYVSPLFIIKYLSCMGFRFGSLTLSWGCFEMLGFVRLFINNILGFISNLLALNLQHDHHLPPFRVQRSTSRVQV